VLGFESKDAKIRRGLEDYVRKFRRGDGAGAGIRFAVVCSLCSTLL
jgi:hypothetical protein